MQHQTNPLSPEGAACDASDPGSIKTRGSRWYQKQKNEKECPSARDRLTIGPHSATPDGTCVERPPLAQPTAGARNAPCGRDGG